MILLLKCLILVMEVKNKFISYIYILLSIAGAVLPTIANIRFVQDYGPGFDLKVFISNSGT